MKNKLESETYDWETNPRGLNPAFKDRGLHVRAYGLHMEPIKVDNIPGIGLMSYYDTPTSKASIFLYDGAFFLAEVTSKVK